MKSMRSSLLIGAGMLALAVPASAETLREALAKAYETSPAITAARANQRATDETVPIARAAGLPTVSTDGGYNNSLFNSGSNAASPNRQVTAGVDLSLPIFTGGAVRNSVRAAETRVEAGQFGLRGTESELFTAVVAAYMDVIRDEAIVGLNQQNVKVLDTNLRASRDRFEVGDLTRTDVAQSEARLSLARAQLQQAEARLIASRENYVRLVGNAPGTLEDPPALPNLPVASDQAVDVALSDNPSLLAARRQSDAAEYDIGTAKAGRLPQVSVVLGGNYYNYLGSLSGGVGPKPGQDGFGGSAGVALRLPLFQGGRVGAQVRQAQARRSAAIENATAAERQVISNTRAAFAVYRSSQQVIASSEEAVKANRLSLEGVRAENSVGTRTILDILNAEQELLNSQVTLVTARRDAYVAGFALLAAMGKAEARDLGLDGGVLYDPLTNYKRVRRNINDFASDGEPDPVAQTTKATPAQDATVTRRLDPILDQPVDRNIVDPAGTPPKK
jgi:outer membrane protein